MSESVPAPQDLQDRYIAAGFCNLGVARKSAEDWYCLLHKVQGAAALPYVLDGTLGHLLDDTSFEDDTLFCEWFYYVDWEAKELTVGGGERESVNVGFADLTEEWMLNLEKEDGYDEE